jgi:hypothetical protein
MAPTATTDYVVAHGRAPQTATMHPDTLQTLGMNGSRSAASDAKEGPIVVTSSDYDRATITLFY